MTGTYHYLAILVQQDLFPRDQRRKTKKPDAAANSGG